LRERSEDIPALFESFLAAFAERYRLERPRLSPEALAALTAHSWPGNVRELRNVAERLAVCAHAGPVRPSDLALQPAEGPEDERPVAPRARASEALYERMVVGGESFWGVVYDPFMLRDLTRQELRQIVRKGLEQTRGSYARLLELFNMTPDDDGRFRQFLRRHQCDVPSERLRTSS
jgi:DNA-binding NtrC family response regulator